MRAPCDPFVQKSPSVNHCPDPENGACWQLELQDLLEDSEKLYLVLEIAAGGDLFDRIVSVGGFTEDDARVFFKQILSGLEHCHKENIVHR